MVKHTQTIYRKIADELLSVFDHFMKLALKGLTSFVLPCNYHRYFPVMFTESYRKVFLKSTCNQLLAGCRCSSEILFCNILQTLSESIRSRCREVRRNFMAKGFVMSNVFRKNPPSRFFPFLVFCSVL